MAYGEEFYGEGVYGGLFGSLSMDPGPPPPAYPTPPLDRARIVYDNLALTATVTASSQVADRPASLLKSPARWKKWRSATGTGAQWVEFAFAMQVVQAVVLVDWKAHTGGSAKAQYWDGAAWQDFGTFSLPSFNPTGVTSVWDEDGTITDRIRVYFTNTATANDYVELGVVLVGAYLEPSATVSDGFEIVLQDPSVQVRSVDGQMEAQTRTPFHVAQGTFEHLTSADREGIARMLAVVGKHRPWFFAIDPTDLNQQLYCTLLDLPYQHVQQGYWTLPIAVEEVR
jgi:hypothetical protein